MGKSYISATISAAASGPDGKGDSITTAQQGSSMFSAETQAPSRGISEDILATARTRNGLPVSRGEIGLDTIIKTPSGEWPVSSLLHSGELIQKPDGTIVAPEVTPQVAQQDNTQEQAEDTGPDYSTPLPPEMLATSQRLVEGCSPEYTQGVIEMAAETFELGERTAEQVARQMNVSTEEAAAMVAQVEAAYTAQAETYVERAGFPADQVFEWARTHARRELGDAIRAQCSTDSCRGYDAVVQKFTQNLDTIMPDVLLSTNFGADIEVKRHQNRIVVGRRGTGDFTDWSNAVRLGLIDVSFG
jgi:hypothetical protein